MIWIIPSLGLGFTFGILAGWMLAMRRIELQLDEALEQK